jgi:proteasome lid subunit RPN8/RPN11
VKVPQKMIGEMLAHAREAYPAEACGIITGTKEALTTLTRCTNVQAADPVNPGRTTRDGYTIDPREQLRILQAAKARGEDYRIIYHSHVDAGAYFSAEDKRVATWESEPVFPGVAYVVISVMNGEPAEANLFTWSEARRDYEGTPL